MHCPYCGTNKLTETFNFNEHSCDRCGCEFKYNENSYRIYVEGNYEKFCESILLEMTNNCDVQVGNVLVQVIRECKKYGPEQLDVMIEHIKNIAQSVLSEAQISRRDRYDAETVIEGIEAFETIGKTLIERAEDLNLDMHNFRRYLENIDYKEAIIEAAQLEESKKGDEDYFDDFPQDKKKDHPGDDPDSTYNKMRYGGHQGKSDDDKEIKERNNIDPDDEDPDANLYGKKAAKDKSEKGHKKTDKKYGVGPSGRRGHRKGDKPKKTWTEDENPIDWNKNPVTNEEWEADEEVLENEEEQLEEADMSDKDTHGKEDWDGTDLPGEGAKEDRTKPTTSAPNLESVSLDTQVKSLLMTKTLTQIAEETDIDEQLVIEAAALGKTLGELFEADMSDKNTRGKEDWDGTDLPGEGAKEDRTKPTTPKPALAEGEEEEVSEETEEETEEEVDLEEAAKEVEEALKEGLVGSAARHAGKLAHSVIRTAIDSVVAAAAALAIDALSESPLIAAALIFVPHRIISNYRSVFNKKDGKVTFNPAEFQKLPEEDQKVILTGLKEAMNKLREKKPNDYEQAKNQLLDRIKSDPDEQRKQKLLKAFEHIFKESNMASFKEFLAREEDIKSDPNVQRAADQAKQANIRKKQAEIDALKKEDQNPEEEDETDIIEEANKPKPKFKDKNVYTHKAVKDAERDENGVRIPTRKAGVYAGGNGKSKPIPFTQDPTLRNQAVGPEIDEEDEGTDIEDANPDPEEKDIEPQYSVPGTTGQASGSGMHESEDPTISNGADTIYDNFIESVDSGKSNWKKMEESLANQELNENCVGGSCSIGIGRESSGSGGGSLGGVISMGNIGGGISGMNPTAPPVADKSEIYAYIKNNDLHNVSREHALATILAKFSNPQEELEQIYDDAIMSNDPSRLEDIDDKYNFKDTMSFDRSYDQISHLNQAWQAMEQSDELKDL